MDVEVASRKDIEEALRACITNVQDVPKYLQQLRQLANEIDEKEADRKSKVFRALGDPLRLKIFMLLSKKSMCGCEVMSALNLTQSNASYHLGSLERAGLIKGKRVRKWVFYSVARNDLVDFINRI